MGATDCYVTLKGKNREALIKDFWEEVKQAKYEHGHGGYSGSAAEFLYLEFTSLVFNNFEEVQDYVSNRGDKNVAKVVQVKVIKDSPTIERWLEESKQLYRTWFSLDEKAKKANDKKREKILEKIKAARLRKAVASKKTEYIACGWVSS